MQAISYHHSFYYHYIPIWLLTRYITNPHTHTHKLTLNHIHSNTHTHTHTHWVSVSGSQEACWFDRCVNRESRLFLSVARTHTQTHTHTHTLAQHNPSRYLIHNTLSAWLSSFNLLFPPSPFFSDPSISNQAFSEDQRAWAWQNHLCLHRKKSYHIIVKHYDLVWRFIHVCLFSYSLGTNLSPWIELNMTNIPLWGRPNVSYIKCFCFN